MLPLTPDSQSGPSLLGFERHGRRRGTRTLIRHLVRALLSQLSYASLVTVSPVCQALGRIGVRIEGIEPPELLLNTTAAGLPTHPKYSTVRETGIEPAFQLRKSQSQDQRLLHPRFTPRYCNPSMVVGAPDLTLCYFRLNLRPRTRRNHHRRNVSRLLASHMIKVEHNHVSFATVNARMRLQIPTYPESILCLGGLATNCNQAPNPLVVCTIVSRRTITTVGLMAILATTMPVELIQRLDD